MPTGLSLKKLSIYAIPTIGSGVSVVANNSAHTCSTTPDWFFAMTLSIFCALLLFNLSYRFRQDNHIRWFWEMIYVILAIWGWSVVDTCRKDDWFPVGIMLTAATIYLSYLHLFIQKIKRDIQ